MKTTIIATKTLPSWAKPRSDEWTYVGWIANPPIINTFEALVEKERRSDHGETREVDVYPQGATCWYRE